MKVIISELKKELSYRQEELKEHLTVRLHNMLDVIVREDFLEEEEMHVFDLIIRIILRADKDPTENIVELMVPLTNESYEELDRCTLSNAAAFIRDYLKKDLIHLILERKKGEKSTAES